jgi:hypothetical protein
VNHSLSLNAHLRASNQVKYPISVGGKVSQRAVGLSGVEISSTKALAAASVNAPPDLLPIA